jgi:hypothetical protein
MKTILKLLIAALVINGVVRAGTAWWSFYQFEDETQETIRFAGSESEDTLEMRILTRAQERDLPIKPDDVNVQREGPRIVASAHYVQPVEFIPSYKYPVKMAFQVEAYSIAGAAPAPRRN